MTKEEMIDYKRKLVRLICNGQTVVPRQDNPDQVPLFDAGADVEGDQLEFIDKINFDGYAEPGYTDPEVAIVTGNWNRDKNDFVPAEMVDPEAEPGETYSVAKALEVLGCECEWLDEWDECCKCGKLLRTSPNSYGWQPSYWRSEYDGPICVACVKKDPEEMIETMTGSTSNAITFDDIDLTEHGFVKLQGDLENGFHPGQDADPKVIGKSLRKHGIDRFLFVIDSTGQFDMEFSVWVDKEELASSGLDAEYGLPPSEVNGRSVSGDMKNYLQDISRAEATLPPGDGVVIVKPDPDNPGRAVAKKVSRQDFIDGKALQD